MYFEKALTFCFASEMFMTSVFSAIIAWSSHCTISLFSETSIVKLTGMIFSTIPSEETACLPLTTSTYFLWSRNDGFEIFLKTAAFPSDRDISSLNDPPPLLNFAIETLNLIPLKTNPSRLRIAFLAL